MFTFFLSNTDLASIWRFFFFCKKCQNSNFVQVWFPSRTCWDTLKNPTFIISEKTEQFHFSFNHGIGWSDCGLRPLHFHCLHEKRGRGRKSWWNNPKRHPINPAAAEIRKFSRAGKWTSDDAILCNFQLNKKEAFFYFWEPYGPLTVHSYFIAITEKVVTKCIFHFIQLPMKVLVGRGSQQVFVKISKALNIRIYIFW